MMHDDLVRQFEALPRPELSPEFGMNLRRQLRAAAPRTRPAPVTRVWVVRLYWVAAIALLARFWPSYSLSVTQAGILAVAFAAVALAVRRAHGPGSLARALRHALRP
jgi:hypothetical protein